MWGTRCPLRLLEHEVLSTEAELLLGVHVARNVAVNDAGFTHTGGMSGDPRLDVDRQTVLVVDLLEAMGLGEQLQVVEAIGVRRRAFSLRVLEWVLQFLGTRQPSSD